ncbi:DUF6496 domain-containing protein [Jiella sp. M17.18]|uniref:DUF6496 domain-containing protein n=1 Tax=Jiella sp. M17.18 TaxID=3234247 RepID=UPI0034DF7916
MAKQSNKQKETVSRVMHEYKHGELRINGDGPKVKSQKQAVAIALHEAGATNQESPKKNRENLSRTKAKERKGETAEAEKEGKKAQDRTKREATGGKGSGGGSQKTKAELYDEAKKQDISGRSKMSKRELEKALH